MDIDLIWEKPRELKITKDSVVLVDGFEDLPLRGGVYVFTRCYGKKTVPLYIGKGIGLRARIKQQFNNHKLMLSVKNSGKGPKFLMIGYPNLKSGQDLEKVVDIIERGLIEHAVSAGHEIINKQGTRLQLHKVSLTGSTKCRDWIDNRLYVPKSKKLPQT